MELYLSSSENGELFTPIKVITHHLLIKQGFLSLRYFLHVELAESIPLFGLEEYGINQKAGANFILTSQNKGRRLKELKAFPINVNIILPKNNNFADVKNNSNLIFYAIAELYDNIDDAKRHIIK